MEELFVEIVKKWRIALSDALNIPEGSFYLFVTHVTWVLLFSNIMKKSVI